MTWLAAVGVVLLVIANVGIYYLVDAVEELIRIQRG